MKSWAQVAAGVAFASKICGYSGFFSMPFQIFYPDNKWNIIMRYDDC